MFEDTKSLKQQIKEFDELHSRQGAPVCDGNWLYFASGAVREINPMGARVKPPFDEHARAKKILNYWQKRLELAVEEFQNLKQTLSLRTKFTISEKFPSPPPSPEFIEQLKAIKKKVGNLQKEVEKAEQQVEDTIPESRRQRQEEAEKNIRANASYNADLSNIEI